ncbi:MAG: hypothetical protein WC957_04465 [Candidatus Neomarinimicrobiota bacterium]
MHINSCYRLFLDDPPEALGAEERLEPEEELEDDLLLEDELLEEELLDAELLVLLDELDGL